MMNNSNKMCAIFSNISTGERMSPLTDNRPIATLPFDCKYRIMDFPLSAISNAGINDVFMIFNEGKTQSVFDHIGSGKEWGLSSLSSHMFIYMQEDFEKRDQAGDPPFATQINFLKKSGAPYTVLLSSKFICNLDLDAILQIHKASEKVVTAVAKKVDISQFNNFDTVIRLDDEKRYYSVDYGQLSDHDQLGTIEYLSLNTFICDTDWLIDFLERMQETNKYSSISHILRQYLWDVDVNLYEFTGYMSNITSIKAFYDANMAMLKPTNFTALLYGKQPIYTKIKNEVPTYFAEGSWAHNSQFGSGCDIEGVVIDSIISRGTKVEKNARVEKSLVFSASTVKEGAEIKYAIVDKNCVIEKGVHIEGTEDKPLVISKGQIVTADRIEK